MADSRNKPLHRIVQIPNPIAGQEVTIVADKMAGWLIRSLRFQLVTSAVVANRAVTLSATDTIAEYFRAATGAVQAASLTRVYAGFAGSAGAVSGGPVVAVGLPSDGLWLPQGSKLQTITDLLDGTDQFSSITVQVLEFPTGPGTFLWPVVAMLQEEAS